VLFDLDLIELDRFKFIGHIANWRQRITFHMRANRVVVLDNVGEQMVKVLLAKNDELRKALGLDCQNVALAAPIEVWRSLR